MRIFHTQIWILCKLFKYVLGSLGSDVEMFPCLHTSVKEITLITKEFSRVKVWPTALRPDCSMEKMKLCDPIPSICLLLMTGGEGRASAQAVPRTAHCRNPNPENLGQMGMPSQPRGKIGNRVGSQKKG